MVKLWRAPTRCPAWLRSHTTLPRRRAGKSLATCAADRTVRIWQQSRYEGRGWRCAAVLEDTHTKSIRCCCWSPGSTHLATASFDGTTAIWQFQGGIWEEVNKLEGHENEVKAVAWSPCGNYLATCGRDKTVWFWERGVGEEYDCMDVKTGHSQDVKSIAWHPSKELLASCSYDNSIKLWVNDEGDWICVQTLEGAAVGHTSTVWSVCFSADGTRLASVSDDLTLRVWNVSWSQDLPPTPHAVLAATISGHHKRTIFSVDWSREGVVATGDAANAINLFAQQGTLEAINSDIAEKADLSIDPAAKPVNGSLGSSGSSAPWECICSVEQAHTADVNCVKWHPQQQGLLASAGDDCVVKLWRHHTPVATAAAPAAAVTASSVAGQAVQTAAAMGRSSVIVPPQCDIVL
eukprot:GHUV01026461.1.p1 GENE.GHUV01026461.1~~GHUV01026461.1.p1  ORF type:complete len:406 (+),score=78.94 GHUV01026461.1:109-1326(+)